MKEYDYMRMVQAINAVKDYYGHDVRNSSRKKENVHIRASIMVLFRKYMGQKYSHIAEAMRCDHATVYHHVSKHEDRMEPKFYGEDYSNIFNQVKELIKLNGICLNQKERITTLQNRRSLPLQRWPEYTTKPSGRWKQCAKNTKYLTSLVGTS